MNVEPLVSVIVPVYNAGEFLQDCLRSIIDQTYKMLEILLVDDGSTDRSAEICDAFAKRDERIRVVHQKNAGAVSARKQGTLLASGEYICFMDADDMAAADMIDFFVNNIGSCDLITSGCYDENMLGEYSIRMDLLEEGIYDTEEMIKYFIENMIVYKSRYEDGVLPFLWNKMYRADLLKKVILDVDTSIVYAEDRDLLFRYILNSKSIYVVHQSFYYHHCNPNSIVQSVNKNFMYDLNGLYLSLERAFENHSQRECLMHQLQLFIVSRLGAIPVYMGFLPDAQIPRYVFPFSELDRGSRVILYGAGNVGICYYRQIYRQKLLRLVLWADKNWKNYTDSSVPVSAPEQIVESEYDYIVIAVKRERLADEIKKQLIEIGIQENRILWRPPAIL